MIVGLETPSLLLLLLERVLFLVLKPSPTDGASGAGAFVGVDSAEEDVDEGTSGKARFGGMRMW